jgi:O-antigen ligase
LAFVLPPEEQDTAVKRISELWNPDLRAEGSYADRSHDRNALMSYLSEHPTELLIGAGPGNFHSYFDRGITRNFFGHNSYLHWTGELGIGGFLLLLAWCLSVCWFMKKRLRSQNATCRLAARTGLAVVTGRMVAAWGAESLFGAEGMGYYSLFFVGTVYLLISIASDVATPDFAVSPRPNRGLAREPALWGAG